MSEKTKDKNKKISKLMSYILRHRPDEYGLTLEEGGWVAVPDLLAACAKAKMPITMNQLETVVKENDKQRFSFSADRQKIRANQGHSVAVDLKLSPTQPPDVLYHGTIAANLDSIKKDGLQKGSRHHVHLSVDVATAKNVGGRRGKPVVLEIDAKGMAAAGHSFYVSDNGVWLCDQVPSQFILFPA